MSKESLYRLSGLAALIAGGLLVVSGISDFEPGLFAAHVLLVFVFMGLYLKQREAAGQLGLWAFVVLSLANLLFIPLLAVDAFVVPGFEEAGMIASLTDLAPLIPAAIPLVLASFVLGFLLLARSFRASSSFPAWTAWLAFASMLLNLFNGPTTPDFLGLLPPVGMGLAFLSLGLAIRKKD